MTPRTKTLLALLLPLSLAGPPSLADNSFALDPEPVRPRDIIVAPERPEGALTLPPWPRDADLIAFDPDGPQQPFKFFIDGKSLSIDSSRTVVRYTLVIESPNGTRNVSHEGIHCTLKGAYKVYAYGSDGRFNKAPETDWQPIDTVGNESYREDLRRNRFCVPRETRPRPIKDMQRALRGNVSPTESTGFQAD